MRASVWIPVFLLVACRDSGGEGNDSASAGTSDTMGGPASNSNSNGETQGSVTGTNTDPSSATENADVTTAGTTADTTAGTDPDGTSGGPPPCEDGMMSCVDEMTIQECVGGEWANPTMCEKGTQCFAGQCVMGCDANTLAQSSLGCSFYGIRSSHSNKAPGQPDSIVVGNAAGDDPIDALLYYVDSLGNQVAQGVAVTIPPGETATLQMPLPPPQAASFRRIGGFYHVETTRPAVAYQHSPMLAQFTNDASLLLPEHVFGTAFVVASQRPSNPGFPLLQQEGVFIVIALEDDTEVSWTPAAPTVAGGGLPAVAAGETESVTLARFEVMHVLGDGSHPLHDLTGTHVTATKPVWFLSAHRGALIRSDEYDHLQEQLFPRQAWGEEYVAAHVPPRGDEVFLWRFFAGTQDTTLTSDPPLPGFPLDIPADGWVEYEANEHFYVSGTNPFLAVQYVVGLDEPNDEGGAPTGGPSIVQAIPVEQFLERYPFVTGEGYDITYIQVIRPAGGPDVTVDGEMIAESDYQMIGANWQVADVEIEEGAHLVESEGPVGIVNTAFYDSTSYSYPGGGGVAPINPQ